jgi:hypothetical protein
MTSEEGAIERNSMLDMLDMLYVPHVNSELLDTRVSTKFAALHSNAESINSRSDKSLAEIAAVKLALSALKNSCNPVSESSDVIREAEAEIERLTIKLEHANDAQIEILAAADNLRQEITGLIQITTNNADASAQIQGQKIKISTQLAEIVTLKAQLIKLQLPSAALSSEKVTDAVDEVVDSQTTILKNILKWADTQASFTDIDFHEIKDNINKYYRQRVKILGQFEGLGGLPIVYSAENAQRSEHKKKLFVDILSIVVEKTGNTRMLVRFNNATLNNEAIEFVNAINKSGIGGNSIPVPEAMSWIDSYSYKNMRLNYQTFTETPFANQKENAFFIDRDSIHEQPNIVGYKVICNGTDITRQMQVSMNGKAAKTFAFEKIFTTETQEQVFRSVEPLLFSAFESNEPLGIFAYGGTGSGKTYTMIGGDKKDMGLIPRLIEKIYEYDSVVSASVQVIEVIPGHGNSTNTNSLLKHKIMDLVQNMGDTKYYKRIVHQDTKRYWKTYEHTGDIADFADATTKDNTKESVSQVNLDTDNFKKFTFRGASSGIDQRGALEGIKKITATRQTRVTIGNPNGSSRSHLVFIFQVQKIGGGTSTVFLTDLAGQESIGKNPDTAASIAHANLSRGINNSLTALTMLITSKKSRGVRGINTTVFKFAQGMQSIRSPDIEEIIAKQLGFMDSHLMENPLIAITKSLWSDEKSKIMVLACMYPFAKAPTSKGAANKYVPNKWENHMNLMAQRKPDGLSMSDQEMWKNRSKVTNNNTEDMQAKYERDLGVLGRLDFTHRLKMKQTH